MPDITYSQDEIIKTLFKMDILSITLPSKEAKTMLFRIVRDSYLNGRNESTHDPDDLCDRCKEKHIMTKEDYNEMVADMLEDDIDEFIK